MRWGGSGRLAQLVSWRLAPQPLERVELARLRREDVDDEVEEVEEDPLRAVVALDVRHATIERAQALLDGVGDRLRLPDVGCRADDEHVGERLRPTQVEEGDTQRFLVAGGLDGGRHVGREFERLGMRNWLRFRIHHAGSSPGWRRRTGRGAGYGRPRGE